MKSAIEELKTKGVTVHRDIIEKDVGKNAVILDPDRYMISLFEPNVKPLLKSEDVKHEFFITSTLLSLRKNNTSFGKLDHVLLKHSKVNVLILQKSDVTFYISINSKVKSLERLSLQ